MMTLLLLTLLGFGLGSFANALIWRIRMQQNLSSKKQHANFSIVKGRSMCPNCRHKLPAFDLIPLFSWIMLGRRCRYCAKPISVQYPLVELSMAILLPVSYIYWPYELGGEGLIRFIIWVPSLVILISLFVYDLKWKLLPDRLTGSFFVLMLMQLFILMLFFDFGFAGLFESLLAILPLGGLFYVLFQLSGGKWIGGGDVKLGVGLGLLSGYFAKSLLLIFAASFMGSLVAAVLMVLGKANKKSQLPFGPFLLLAAVFTHLFGVAIIASYQRAFL